MARRSLIGGVAALALLGALVGGLGFAGAHERSVSYLSVRSAPDGDGWRAAVTLRVRRLDLARLASEHPSLGPPAHGAALTAAAGARLMGFIELRGGGEPCAPIDAPGASAADRSSRLTVRFALRCGARPDALAVTGLWGVAGHLVVVRAEPDRPDARAVLTALSPALHWGAPRPPTAAVFAGALHIASGYDHVAFVLLLVLGVGGLREAAVTVTGFTIGHSLTLSLLALGLVEVDARAVEAVIALSVVALAAERAGAARPGGAPGVEAIALPVGAGLIGLACGVPALLGAALITASGLGLLRAGASPTRVRQALSALFGLAHGLGFAGALTEGAGPPSPSLLIGWNLGVELGQLAIVGAALPLLAALDARGLGAATRAVGVFAGAAVGVVALGYALAPR